MCLVLYAASDIPLPLVPWDPAQPAFYVDKLPADAEAVRARFSKPHVYSVGSHEKCACGFNVGQWPEQDPEEVAVARDSLQRLETYLVSATRLAGPIELYACWVGEETLEPRHRLDLTPDRVWEPDLWSEEPTFVLLRAAP